jgi:hypothetical protein
MNNLPDKFTGHNLIDALWIGADLAAQASRRGDSGYTSEQLHAAINSLFGCYYITRYSLEDWRKESNDES